MFTQWQFQNLRNLKMWKALYLPHWCQVSLINKHWVPSFSDNRIRSGFGPSPPSQVMNGRTRSEGLSKDFKQQIFIHRMQEKKREEWLINSLPWLLLQQPPPWFYWPPEGFWLITAPEQKPPYGSKLQRLVTQHRDNLCPLRVLRFIQASPYEPSAGR